MAGTFLSVFANQNMHLTIYWQHGYRDSSHLAPLLDLSGVERKIHTSEEENHRIIKCLFEYLNLWLQRSV